MKNNIFKPFLVLSLSSILVGCNPPPHEHQFTGAYKYDNNEHWQECECGESSSKEAHSFDDGQILEGPSQDTKGIKEYSCLVCDFNYTEDYYEVPSSPVNFEVVRSLSSANLTWETPTNNGGKEISHYEVYLEKEGEGGVWITAERDYEHTFTNLFGGVNYDFKVRAVNEIGGGETASLINQKLRAPGKVQNLRTEISNGRVDFFYDEPAILGGAEIIRYEYDYGKGWTSNNLKLTTYIYELVNGEEHIFKIRAVNLVGEGEVESISFASANTSSKVTNLNVTLDDKTALVSWEAPEEAGDSPVLGYQIAMALTSELNFTYTDIGLATSYSYSDLSYGLSYRFIVRTYSDLGYGIFASSSVHVLGIPGPVENIETYPSNMAITLTWNNPLNHGNAALAYEFSYDEQATWRSCGRETRLSGLKNNQEYTFYIRAKNALGTGEIRTVKATPGPAPSEPRITSYFAGNGEVSLAWTDPTNASTYEYPITSYAIKVGEHGVYEDVGLTYEKKITGLENDAQVRISVSAINSIGKSYPKIILVTPTAKCPEAPTVTCANPNISEKTLVITFSILTADYYNAKHLYFEIKKDDEPWIQTEETYKYTFTDMVVGETNTFYVRAVSNVGAGKIGEATQTFVELPSSPTNPRVAIGIGKLTVSWTAPESFGAGSFLRYEVKIYIQNSTTTEWFSVGSSIEYVITNPVSKTQYYFYIRAVSEYGPGDYGAATMTYFDPPTTPGNFRHVISGLGEVTLFWDASTCDTPVQCYEVSTDQKNWDEYPVNVLTAVYSNLTIGEPVTFYLRARNGYYIRSETVSLVAIPTL